MRLSVFPSLTVKEVRLIIKIKKIVVSLEWFLDVECSFIRMGCSMHLLEYYWSTDHFKGNQWQYSSNRNWSRNREYYRSLEWFAKQGFGDDTVPFENACNTGCTRRPDKRLRPIASSGVSNKYARMHF